MWLPSTPRQSLAAPRALLASSQSPRPGSEMARIILNLFDLLVCLRHGSSNTRSHDGWSIVPAWSDVARSRARVGRTIRFHASPVSEERSSRGCDGARHRGPGAQDEAPAPTEQGREEEPRPRLVNHGVPGGRSRPRSLVKADETQTGCWEQPRIGFLLHFSET